MESFAQLRRRTTDLLESLPQNLPSMSSVAAGTTSAKKDAAAMKGTWEKIDIPSLPRSSHSVNVVYGSAYIFGGDAQPGRPVDNDMHVVVLPYNNAGSDHYKIKAVAPKVYVPPSEEFEPTHESAPESTPTSATAASEAELGQGAKAKGKSKENLLDDVPLASPIKGTRPPFEDDEEEDETEMTPTTSASQKGKQPEGPPSPSTSLPDVPSPRAGHATATVGHRIFLFGGRDPVTSEPLSEYGRVWVFDTRNHTWTYLDPVPPAPGVTLTPMPGPRHGHAAASTERPREFAARAPKRTRTWKQWAQGDSAEVGTPQAPIVGNVAAKARDEEDDGYGTLFIHGGVVSALSIASATQPFSSSPPSEGVAPALAPSSVDDPADAANQGKRTNDLWAFDIRSRVWTQLPAAPGPGRAGASLCVSKSRLYRFGGTDGTAPLGGQIDFVHLEVETFNEGGARSEVSVRARDGWQSVMADASLQGDVEIPLVAGQKWPLPRSFAGLEAVAGAGGREYLVLVGGESAEQGQQTGLGLEAGQEKETAAATREGTLTSEGVGTRRTACGDVWAFQVPPQGMTSASLGDALWQAMGRQTGEGKWTRLSMGPWDDEVSYGDPVARSAIATAPMGELEESGIVVWGGLSESGRRLGDGWILRLGEREAP